LAIKQQISM